MKEFSKKIPESPKIEFTTSGHRSIFRRVHDHSSVTTGLMAEPGQIGQEAEMPVTTHLWPPPRQTRRGHVVGRKQSSLAPVVATVRVELVLHA
jgi:hypothetical protein